MNPEKLILSYLTPFVIFILFVPFLLLVVPIPFVSFVPFVPFVLLVPLSHTPPSCPLFPASLSPSPSNVFHLSSSPPLSLLPACQLCQLCHLCQLRHLPFIPFVIFMPSSPLFTLPPSPSLPPSVSDSDYLILQFFTFLIFFLLHLKL